MMDRTLSPLKIVILYALCGISWILFSDLFLSAITEDPAIYTKISIVKGWLYVVLTAALLYWLIILYSKQRTQAENALRETEDRYRQVVEGTADIVTTVDAEGRFTFINTKAETVFGLTAKECVGRVAFDFVHPDDRDATKEWFSGAIASRKSVAHFENRQIAADGRIIYALWTCTFHYGADEGLVFVDSIARDITERRQVENLLRDSVSRLRATLESTADGILVVDNQGRISDFNDQFAHMWRIPKSILDRRDDRQALDFVLDQLADPDQFVAKVKELYAKPDEVSFDVLAFKDGRVFERLSRPQKIDDRPVGRVWSFRDVTEHNRAEKELGKYRTHLEELVAQRTKEVSLLNDQLRQAQKLEAVGILAGGIAHEFNNILATMKGSMYLIQKKLPEGSPTVKYAEQVVASIGKATELSQGLLTFSRKQKIFLRPVHFNEIIRSVGKMLVQLVGEDIEFAMRLTDKNPIVIADVNQIEQVLVNLAANARDAMPYGGRLTIATDVMKMDEDFKKQHGYGHPAEYVVLTVSDSGTGIEETVRGKIFEPFFTTKAEGKGSGLGLAVTYGIVKQHNGFIDVESVPAKGTTFTIYFPTEEAQVVQPIGQDRSLSIGGTETVLLAEDDEDARATMCEMVRMVGYTVLEARDGEEAIRVFMENKDKVQLVFLDVRMPKKHGGAVYEEIKRIQPQTKFLFISGYTANIMDSLGASEGANFISKAASPDEILRKIREVLDY
jgi:PAS domain S-box-containing protein